MRNEEQYAATLLRLIRKKGVTCTLGERDGKPAILVKHAEKLSNYDRNAIVKVRPYLLALLEAEQRNGRCEGCGAGDWGPIGPTVELRDGPHPMWQCRVCHTPLEKLKVDHAAATLAMRHPQAETTVEQ